MLSKKIVGMKLREISINFNLEVKKEYLEFIFNKLNEYDFSEKRFIRSAERILKRENTLFNKMPPLGMFINPILDDKEKFIEKFILEEENRLLLENQKK